MLTDEISSCGVVLRAPPQASLSELQHELSVLEAIPEGSVGRIVAGDTLLGDLGDTEQQLAAELESIRQEAAKDQVRRRPWQLSRDSCTP